MTAFPIEKVEVSAYTIPTDSPEADGTFSWDKTTLVLVEGIDDLLVSDMIKKQLHPEDVQLLPAGNEVGERVLLPAVHRSDRDTLIIANGFSCREQISQSTDRRALHLAEVIRMAGREGPQGPGIPYPERKYQLPDKRGTSSRETAILIGAGALIAGAAWMALRRKRRWL